MRSTILHVKCPKCKQSLKDELHLINGQPSIKVDVLMSGIRGSLYLSSIWGDYSKKSTVGIPNGAIVEMYCPHCSRRLISEKKCHDCHTWLVPMDLEEGGKVFICSRAGCHVHEIKPTDYRQLQAIQQNEYKSGFKDEM